MPVALIVLTEGFPNSLKLSSWEAAFHRRAPVRRVAAVSEGMLVLMMRPGRRRALEPRSRSDPSGLMRTYRVGVYVYQGGGGVRVADARALSQLVDSALSLFRRGGLLVDVRWIRIVLRKRTGDPLRFFTLMGAVLAWMVAVFVGFSPPRASGGRAPASGSPGSGWSGPISSLRIRRALLRNLLKLIDGFFNFLSASSWSPSRRIATPGRPGSPDDRRSFDGSPSLAAVRSSGVG